MTVASLSEPMVEVGAYPNRSDAELARAALAAAGIPSVLSVDDAGGAYPSAPMGGARLFVSKSDAAIATEILATRPNGNGEGSH
jgi:hypothetical protein